MVQRFNAATCHLPVNDRSQDIVVMTIIFTTMNLVFFSFKMVSRLTRLAPWGWDDTTVLIGWTILNGFIVGDVISIQSGLGRDIWTLEFSQVDRFLQVLWVFQILYSVAIGVIKAAFLFLYLRLFVSWQLRRWLWATQLFNLLLTVAFVIVNFAQCQPVSYNWTKWDGEVSLLAFLSCVLSSLQAIAYCNRAYMICNSRLHLSSSSSLVHLEALVLTLGTAAFRDLHRHRQDGGGPKCHRDHVRHMDNCSARISIVEAERSAQVKTGRCLHFWPRVLVSRISIHSG